MKASEPAPAYNTASFQALKDRIIASVNTATDESKLEQCLASCMTMKCRESTRMRSLKKNYACLKLMDSFRTKRL